MTEKSPERNMFDAIKDDPRNRGKDSSVVDLAEKAVSASGFIVPSLAELASTIKTPTVDLKTPAHFRDYFVYNLSRFLGQEVSLALPSQEHVDRGQRIKDAGLTTYQPVACPKLSIVEGYQYPENWKFPLDPWIYEQIANKNLKPDVLNLKEMYGWLDVSPGLDWKSNDPMVDPNIDQVMADLLVNLRENGKIAVSGHIKHLDKRSPYGVSADEGKNAVYPALAEIFGVKKGEVVDLTAAQFNFIGSWLYFVSNEGINLGGANSWIWLNDRFGAVRRLVGGRRDGGGLSGVSRHPSDDRDGSIRIRPLVVSPSAA